jgi:hypothetical protein
MTSPETLSTLRNLHKTHPILFDELSRNIPTTDDNVTIEEPVFSDVIDDASDIPINTVKSHITSGSVDEGFLVTEDGDLLRAAAAEDTEFDQEDDNSKKSVIEPVGAAALGKGRRMRKAPKPFGGEDAWSM